MENEAVIEKNEVDGSIKNDVNYLDIVSISHLYHQLSAQMLYNNQKEELHLRKRKITFPDFYM